MTKDQPQSGNAMAIDQLDRLHTDLDCLQSDADHVLRLATIGTLAAGLAHEVNNLLTPALAYLQLAQGNPSDQEMVAKALEKALAGIESATGIAEALLGFSTETDETAFANLGEVVASAIECLPRNPSKDGIDVTVDLPAGAAVGIRPHALQHVFLNLILNACEALRGRRGTVTISARAPQNGPTEITVTDSGPGISSEVAGRIFEPFVSTSGSDDHGHHGTGLGLAVCKHLIEQASGTISASSSAGQGTTFTIHLPPASQRARAKKAG